MGASHYLQVMQRKPTSLDDSNRTALKFGIPMIWHEPPNHFDDCYFCMTKLVGYNKKNRKNILYPSIPSATRPIPHSCENPVPVFKELLGIPISAVSLALEPVTEELAESNSNPEILDNDNDIDYHKWTKPPQPRRSEWSNPRFESSKGIRWAACFTS